MTRSFDQAKTAADRLNASMKRAKASDRFVTQEQLQAAGFAEQPRTDPNAGLPRYEDVVGHAPQPEQPPMPDLERAHHPFYGNFDHEAAVERVSQPQPEHPIYQPPPPQAPQPQAPQQAAENLSHLVGTLIQQVNTLMQENAALRDQMMSMMQGGGAPQQPQQRQVPRAANLTDEQKWRQMHSDAGLLG